MLPAPFLRGSRPFPLRPGGIPATASRCSAGGGLGVADGPAGAAQAVEGLGQGGIGGHGSSAVRGAPVDEPRVGFGGSSA
jgi:hypothetical protein